MDYYLFADLIASEMTYIVSSGALNSLTHLIKTEGWVGLFGWPTADSLPTKFQ